MIQILKENLSRQTKALMLLNALLEEEFSRLTSLNPQGVSQLELTIQELLRQIAAERSSLMALVGRIKPGVRRVRGLRDEYAPEVWDEVEALLQRLDAVEQKGAVQAAKNQRLALGLYDQSTALLKHMHVQLQPKRNDAYGANGRFVKPASRPNLISGRL